MINYLTRAVSESFGIEDSALRLVLTLLVAYPIGIFYRNFLYQFHEKPYLHYGYFVITGVLMVMFNYGWAVYHSALNIFVAYLLCRFFGQYIYTVVFSIVFHMAYLLAGYIYSATDEYDITWTMPQCILTLRLIGMVWDVYDGYQPQEKLSEAQRKTAFRERPRLLETFGYCYFYGSFLVGPQLPMSRFRQFVAGEFKAPGWDGPPQSLTETLLRFVPGVLYFIGFQYFSQFYYPDYLMTDEFAAESWLSKRITIVIMWRITIWRYMGAWLVSEGSCILSGIAYNGQDENDKPMWDGVRNIRLRHIELGCAFQSYVVGFNVNTNMWAAQYVHKRLRFLGNKTVSHLSTLLFLSIWHGLSTGYLVLFFYEFLCIQAERQLFYLISKVEFLQKITNPPVLRPFWWVVCKIFTSYCCGFAFVAFMLLRSKKWMYIYSLLYYDGWILYFVLWPAIYYGSLYLIKQSEKGKRKKEEGEVSEKGETEEKKEL